MTIRAMTNGSAPGWDGLPNEFFKILAGHNEKDEGAPTSRLSKIDVPTTVFACSS